MAHIVAVYDFYETVTERLLDSITAMMVNLTCSSNGIRMNIQMGCMEEIANMALDDIGLPYGNFTYEIIDEDVVINLFISKGGAAAQ